MKRAIALVCYLAVGLGHCFDDLRIFHGSQAEQFKYPYIVSIKYDNQHICGGFVYNARFVVTTAGCIKDKEIGLLNVVAAEYDITTDEPETEERKVVKALYPHESYDATLQLNDIALIETANAFDLSNGSFVTFGKFDDYDKEGRPVKFLGWGISNQDENEPTSTLQETLLQIYYPPTPSCYEIWNTSFVPGTMFCVGPYTDAKNSTAGYPCKYDEGSPLLQLPPVGQEGDEIIVGIMSHNKGCDEPNRSEVPTLFTRLSPFYAWMQRTAGPQPS